MACCRIPGSWTTRKSCSIQIQLISFNLMTYQVNLAFPDQQLISLRLFQ
jgi:hypothetical protein